MHRFKRKVLLKKKFWRGGRVVDCGGLENRCAARHPGFESLSLRKKKLKISVLQNKCPILHTKNVKLGVFIIFNNLIDTTRVFDKILISGRHNLSMSFQDCIPDNLCIIVNRHGFFRSSFFLKIGNGSVGIFWGMS